MRPFAPTVLGVLAALASGAAAAADPLPLPLAPALSFRIQDTTDLWRNTTGGAQVGDAILEKLDLGVDWSGATMGHPDLSARVRIIATNADFFSGRYVGDLQTLSNIEGDGYLHAFEIWGQKTWADKASLRAGFLDLNADFDSIQTAGLFLNSSHGIGPDLSQSALVGPSIFPVTGLGVRGQWTPDKAWTFDLGVYDGLPGKPGDPGFASTDLSSRDGATVIAEADRRIGDAARAGLGGWFYTARYALIGEPGFSQRGQGGVYAFIEGPIPRLRGVGGWVRVGVAAPAVDVVSGYIGAGLTSKAGFIGRGDDLFGIAVARAGIGAPTQAARGLGGSETSFEATYRTLVRRGFAIQPDVQYILDPGGRYRNATVVGLRIVLTAKGAAGQPPKPEDEPPTASVETPPQP